MLARGHFYNLRVCASQLFVFGTCDLMLRPPSPTLTPSGPPSPPPGPPPTHPTSTRFLRRVATASLPPSPPQPIVTTSSLVVTAITHYLIVITTIDITILRTHCHPPPPFAATSSDAASDGLGAQTRPGDDAVWASACHCLRNLALCTPGADAIATGSTIDVLVTSWRTGTAVAREGIMRVLAAMTSTSEGARRALATRFHGPLMVLQTISHAPPSGKDPVGVLRLL